MHSPRWLRTCTRSCRRRGLMSAEVNRLSRKIWQTLSSIKTGVVLLILVVVLSAAGTIVLQRPATDPDEMQRAYAPQVLRFLDAMGLTDLGVVLLILVVVLSAAGTIVLQRPATDPDEMQRAYAPQVLRFLDAMGLT